MPVSIYHRPTERCPWQIWKTPDSEDERRHAITTAKTRDPDRWEWVKLNGKQEQIALYICGFVSRDSCERYLEAMK